MLCSIFMQFIQYRGEELFTIIIEGLEVFGFMNMRWE